MKDFLLKKFFTMCRFEFCHNRKKYVLLAFVLTFMNLLHSSNGSVLDWVWPDRNVQNYRADIEHSVSPLPAIPFEFSETNDRFIMDMSKVLGIPPFDLDFCQQRVILSLKNSCNTLTDEEIGKLAIDLMNCQHSIIDCSPKVLLEDCISRMTDDIKESYGQVLARIKSVCLGMRQEQFRGITELTIKKLMSQVERLRTSQNQLEHATLNSIYEISDNQLKIFNKQIELLKLTDAQKLSTEENLKEMLREKTTLKTTNADLNLFISKLKNKIAQGLDDLNEKNSETKNVFKQLFDDLSQINEISHRISQRLLNIDKLTMNHQKQSNDYLETTIIKLKYANDIVKNFSDQINGLKEDFHSKLKWMEPYLGTEDIFTYRWNLIFVHLLYLLFGMICLVFINATTTSRFLLLGIILCSLLCTLYDIINLNLIMLMNFFIALVVVNILNKLNNSYDMVQKITGLFKFKSNMEEPRKEIRIPIQVEKNCYIFPKPNTEGNNNEYDDEQNEIIINKTRTLTSLRQKPDRPIHHRISHEFEENFNLRCGSTPIANDKFSLFDLERCKAITRGGTRCQLTTLSCNSDFCRIHDRSSRER